MKEILLTISLLLIPVSTSDVTIMSQNQLPINPDKETPDTAMVVDEIKRQSVNVDVSTALRIADCESDFKYDAENPNSTAKGVYQFLDGTWDWIGAEGHQFDYKENIKQFMLLYPSHKSWWECS